MVTISNHSSHSVPSTALKAAIKLDVSVLRLQGQSKVTKSYET